jgi:trans-aconitate 2-methyltransferase
MSDSPQKDFAPIADDYAFFEAHATEAEEDVSAYLLHLAGIAAPDGSIRMLDFGCGSGAFTARFLQRAGWPPERLQLTLVEPVESALRQAVARLAEFTTMSVAHSATLPGGSSEHHARRAEDGTRSVPATGAGGMACFDLVLANHVFYYVPDLRGHLARLIEVLSPSGRLLTAIAGRANALIGFWLAGFASIGREVPYHTAEDVEAALQELGANYTKQPVPYELAFDDTEENRLKILRFLLSDHLGQMPRRMLLEMFDRYAREGRIWVRTFSEHFVVTPRRMDSR